jgi:hypothetical protein
MLSWAQSTPWPAVRHRPSIRLHFVLREDLSSGDRHQLNGPLSKPSVPLPVPTRATSLHVRLMHRYPAARSESSLNQRVVAPSPGGRRAAGRCCGCMGHKTHSPPRDIVGQQNGFPAAAMQPAPNGFNRRITRESDARDGYRSIESRGNIFL